MSAIFQNHFFAMQEIMLDSHDSRFAVASILDKHKFALKLSQLILTRVHLVDFVGRMLFAKSN
jgi:hypothetical protein